MKKKDLIKELERLKKRVDVLEFMQEANGKKFTIKNGCMFFHKPYCVKFLSNDHTEVIQDFITTSLSEDLIIHNDYIEIIGADDKGVWKINRVFTIEDDKLKSVNVDLYIKAYSERANVKFDKEKAVIMNDVRKRFNLPPVDSTENKDNDVS